MDAARAFGASVSQIIIRHIVPNAIQPIIVQVTLMLAIALLAEASLSFLALGVQPPQASWGGMLARAYNYIEIAPAQMYTPGLAILLTALAFNALGESMRVALDPTMKRLTTSSIQPPTKPMTRPIGTPIASATLTANVEA